MKAPVIIYDLNMNRVAYLENAFNVGYEKIYNSLWKASLLYRLTTPKIVTANHSGMLQYMMVTIDRTI